jgi:hypothetical protein
MNNKLRFCNNLLTPTSGTFHLLLPQAGNYPLLQGLVKSDSLLQIGCSLFQKGCFVLYEGIIA